MYSIRDTKSELYSTPWYAINHATAIRNFSKAVNSSESPIKEQPEDYDLWYVGEYDDNTGKINPEPTPQHISKAVDCLKNKQADAPF